MIATSTESPLVQGHELYRFFHIGDDEAFALRGVSVELRGGEFVAIVGPSGSGKSTLLACLAGLDEPDGGWVTVGGRRMTRRPETERAALRAGWIGMLLQSGNLLEHLSVRDNVFLAKAMARRQGSLETDALLEAVGLANRRDSRPSSLSGGEAARAGLAAALAHDPPVLLADEPTGEVDAETEEVLLGMLAQRAERGGAILAVTHSERVASAAGRVVRLVDGRIQDG